MPKTIREEIVHIQEQVACEQATGCRGSGDFRRWAEQQGYPYCEVFDWTSSAGDWSFMVSKDGNIWHMMFQENNYPRPGFTRTIDESRSWEGPAQAVLQLAYDEMLANW